MTSTDDWAGAPARPSQLHDSIFSPEQIKVVGQAFDAAWERIAPGAGATPESVQVARLNLADIILRLATTRALNSQELTEAALKRMFTDPHRL